jgi:hypothetical protein
VTMLQKPYYVIYVKPVHDKIKVHKCALCDYSSSRNDQIVAKLLILQKSV